MPPLFDLARRPLQPLIPQLDVKGWRTEDQQRHPLPPILGHIAQHPPNRIGVLEIMLGGYLSIETLPLGVLDEANGNYLQQQRFRRASIDQTIAKVNGHPPSSANPNQERQENLLTLATPNPYPTGCQPPWTQGRRGGVLACFQTGICVRWTELCAGALPCGFCWACF